MRPSSPTRQPPAATTEADDRIDPHVRGLTAEGGSLAGAGPGATKPRKDLVDLLVQQAHERAGLRLPSGAADPASSDEDTAMPRVPADAARPASSRSPADARASALAFTVSVVAAHSTAAPSSISTARRWMAADSGGAASGNAAAVNSSSGMTGGAATGGGSIVRI